MSDARIFSLRLWMSGAILAIAPVALAHASNGEPAALEALETPANEAAEAAAVPATPLVPAVVATHVVDEPAHVPTTPTALSSSLAPGPSFQAERFRPSLTLEAEVFGGLAVSTKESYSEFEVHRGEIGLRAEPTKYAGVELRLESFRSATPGSLLGVDGNSMTVRVKRAQGYAHADVGPMNVEVRLGMIQDLWIETLESQYDFRGLAPLLAEAGDFYDTSDAGASVVLRGPAQFLGGDAFRLALSFTNGEGRRETERNSGKNVSAVLSIQPVVAQLWNAPLRLGIHATLRDGSIGAGSARNHRRAVALTVHHDRFEAGFEWAKALGYRGQGNVDASGVGVWAGGQAIPGWLGAVVRYDSLNPDLSANDVGRSSLSAALFTDLGLSAQRDATVFGRVRFYVGVQSLRHENNAAPVVGAPHAGDETRVLFWVASTGGATLK